MCFFFIIIFRPISVFSQVKADFIFDKSEGCGSLAVSFSDQSTSTSGNINDWYWDLGGVISVRQNPGIIFTKPGEYTICLTVKTTTGATEKKCKDKVIKVYENPVSDFSADIKSGCIPANAAFINKSSSKNGPLTSLIWDVGGSSNLISTADPAASIKTTYTSPGNYSASLSVIDIKGCKNTTTKPNLIEVVALKTPKLDYTLISSCALPWEVKYENLNIDPGTTYHWDFGNGETYTGIQPPVVKYNTSGSFTVKLAMEKGPCIDTVLFDKIVSTNRIIDFETDAQGLCAEQNIKLKDISNFYADSLIWDFGDGTFSKENNPEKTYTQPGCYEIKLTKFIGTCVQETKKPCINISPKPKVDFNIVNGFSCLIPAKVELLATADLPGAFAWKIQGNNIDTTLQGSNHNFIINTFGTYRADLTYLSNSGCIVTFEQKKIDISPFEVSLPDKGPDGCLPFQTNLSNYLTSTAPIVSWQWQVGSPAIFTSTEAEPIFEVNQTGRWDVKLIAENSYGCKDTVERPNYLWAGTPPVFDFTASPIAACISEKRKFTATGGTNVDFWSWTYNDNIFFSNEKNPEYAFPDIGGFDISLTASYNGCKKNIRKDKFISVYNPKSSFKVEYDCQQPETVKITNQSLGADSLYWVVTLSPTKRDTIRDSLLSTYTFPGRGLYFLSHYAKNFSSGCEHIASDSIFIVDLIAAYTLDTVRGCAPLEVKISTLIQDAVITKFEDGNYNIINPNDSIVNIIFSEPGVIFGPKLIVTDRHGCVDSFQATTPVEVSRITAKLESPDVFCSPDIGIFKNISTIGKAPLVEKKWAFTSGNQTSISDTAVFNITDPGRFIVSLKLRDQWGCSDSVKKEIIAVPLIPAFSADTLSCTQKTVRFKIDSDPMFLNGYLWQFGDGNTSTDKNPLYTFASEGSYNICAELFDSRGCSKKICKPGYVEIKNPKADFTGDPVSAPCPPLLSDFKNKSVNASSFTWDFGDLSGVSYNLSPSHVYTVPGQFDVSLYAEMIPGCVDTIVKPDFITLLGPKANMELTVSGNCLPLDIKLTADSDKPYEYIWDYGDGKIDIIPGLSSKDTTDYTYTTPGTYIPKLLVADDNGCSRTFTSKPVEVNTIIPDFTTSLIPLCGLPVDLKIENKTKSTSPDVEYKWVAEGIRKYDNLNENPVFKLEEYGKYSLSLIAKAPNCIDSLRRDSIVEVASLPVPDFVFTDSLSCQNVKVGISNTTKVEYGIVNQWLWTFSNGLSFTDKTPGAVFDKNGAHIVKLSAVTDKGCRDSTVKTLAILPNTLITLPADKTICIGDSTDIQVQVTSSGQYNQSWIPHPTISCDSCTSINVKPNANTYYYFSTQSFNGCKNSDSLLVTVIDTPGPKLQMTSDTTVCKSGTAGIQIINYNSRYSYQWDEGDKGLDCYAGCKSVKASPEKNTFYSVLVKNEYGCYKEDSVLVSVETSIPDFLVEGKTICENKSTLLNIKSGNNPFWSPDPTLSCSSCRSPSAKPDKEKYYFVTVTSDNGCKYSDSILVKLQKTSSINAGEDRTVCKGEIVSLAGVGEGKIEWISDVQIENASSLNATSKPEKTAKYILRTQNDECILSDSLNVIVLIKSEIRAVGDTVCPGEIALLSASGNAERYQWIKNGKSMGAGDTLTLFPDKTMNLQVIGLRSTCIPDTADVNILVYPEIEYKIDRKEYYVYLNTRDQVEATFNSTGNYKYSWEPSNGLSCSDCPDPVIKNITQATDYSVIIRDKYGCSIDDKIFVLLDNECIKDGFYIPNIFTPYNRDGINDIFNVYAEDATEFISISVYDRWGEKVWSTTNLEDSWDGYYLGRELVSGVYTYIITARCDNTNQIINFAGDVTIIH
ncbi:MAG: gliding motility-associated C-terminal domain-containing protein [Saprospiraceae bacterium]|nr:gliding motility-associated C-terminal domain-containing protein [Saprospiraceae bacterium]